MAALNTLIHSNGWEGQERKGKEWRQEKRRKGRRDRKRKVDE